MHMVVSMDVDQHYLSRKRPFSAKPKMLHLRMFAELQPLQVSHKPTQRNTVSQEDSTQSLLLDVQILVREKYVDMKVASQNANHCIRKDCCVVDLYCKACYCVIPFKTPHQPAPLRSFRRTLPRILQICMFNDDSLYLSDFGTERMKVLLYFGD